MDAPGSSTDHDLIVVHTAFPDAHVLMLRGTANAHAHEDLEKDLARAVGTGHRLIVDLTALEHGDENLLGLLIGARRTHGVELIGPLSPSFQHRLDTAGIAHWFTIHPTLATALTPSHNTATRRPS
ncbi:STAS domain-containing protein [Streptomyces globisporus]|uniref:STAS domain-containing protein n=1 Tax=Streptomyces globisporus TaxID=1908 RepID=UPI003658CF91